MGTDLVDVQVLGPIRARRNAEWLELGGSRQRRLLAALAVDAGRIVPAERLADRVWSDGEEPKDPRRAVRTGVTRLRQVLGPTSVITEAAGYRLDDAAVRLDVKQFEALLAEADRAELGTLERLERLDAALGLWQGRAYDDVADEEWAMAEVARLEGLRATVTERCFEAMLAAGRHTDAAGELRGAIASFPLSDRLVGFGMLALYRCGRQAEASRLFQEHRRRLAEAGLVPGPELEALDRRVLTRDASLDAPESAGRRLAGYRIGEQLGEGAFAVVYRGTQPSVGRDVAVKVIRAELSNRPEFVRRFEAEAHVVARLEHPHIVPLYDYWRDPDGAFLVFRYLRGGTLETRLTAAGALSVEECRTMVTQVGGALAAAHRQGVVHRDVKPANVFCDEAGHFYLGDFGIATGGVEANDPAAAARSLSAGSLAYASPEQLRRQPVGPPADVHGLGISLYEALTAQLPFPDALTHAALLDRQLHRAVPSVRAARPDVPGAVDEVIARATAKAAGDRYPQVEDLVEAFLRATDGRPSSAADGGRRRRGTATALAHDQRNPYKGLRAFTEADAGDFRGRARLVDRLVAGLSRLGTAGRLAVLVGPSGIGKSSVVRAGLLPALRRGAVAGSDRWFVASMLPGRDPFDELAVALLRVATTAPADLVAQLDEDHRGLARVVKTLLPADGDGEVLLVVDQFEELFTLVDDDLVQRRFLDALEFALTDARCPLRVVLTLRADFYDRPLRHPSFARLIEPATVVAAALAPDELEAAIVEPAAAVGCEFEPGLVSQIVADVGDQPGALPLLQYALTQLHDRQVSGLLTLDAYRQLGGVAGALAGRAEELVGDESPEALEACRRLFGRLVTLGEGVEDTRRRARRSEVARDEATEAVIDRFGAARLLSFDRDPATREPTVEVAHEALIRAWPRLRGWLDDDRDDLRTLRHLSEAATTWDVQGRDDADVYRGARLAAALDWQQRRPEDATATEAAFLDAGRRVRDAAALAERRQARRLRGLLAGVAVVAVVALVAGALAFVQRGRAEANAEVATAARQRADIDRLAAEAAARVDDDRQLALLLAAEAFRQEQTPRTYGALQRVLSRTGPFLGLVGAGTPFGGVGWTDDGRLVGVGPNGVAAYDPLSGRLVGRVDEPVGTRIMSWGDGQSTPYALASTAPSGGRTVVVGPDGVTAKLVDPVDGTSAELFRHPGPVDAVAISPTGSVVATLEQAGTLRLFDVATLALRTEVAAHPERTYAEQLPAGVRFYSTTAPPALAALPVTGFPGHLEFPNETSVLSTQGISIRRWDAATGRRLADATSLLVQSGVLVAPIQALNVRLGPDGRTFTWHDAQRVVVGEFAVGPPPASFDVPGTGIAMSTPKVSDVVRLGDTLWSLLNDGRLVRTRLDGSDRMEAFTGVRDPVALAADRDGRRLAVSGANGVAVLATDGSQLIARAGPRASHDSFSLNARGDLVAGLTGDPYAQVETPLFDVTVRGLEPRSDNLGKRWATFLDHGSLAVVNPFGGGRIELYDPDTVTRRIGLENVPYWTSSVDSADGRWIALGETGNVALFDTTTGKRTVTYESGDPANTSLTIDPASGRLLATFSQQPPVLLEVPTLRVLERPTFAEGRPVGARWTRDGRWLLTVDEQRRVSVRNPQTFELVSVLDGSQMAQFMAFVPAFSVGGGERILSVVNDAPALWDARTGTPIGAPFPMSGGMSTDGVDGLDLAVSGLDEHVLLWDLDVDGWYAIACRAAGRNLTAEEWARFGPRDQAYRPTCSEWPSGS